MFTTEIFNPFFSLRIQPSTYLNMAFALKVYVLFKSLEEAQNISTLQFICYPDSRVNCPLILNNSSLEKGPLLVIGLTKTETYLQLVVKQIHISTKLHRKSRGGGVLLITLNQISTWNCHIPTKKLYIKNKTLSVRGPMKKKLCKHKRDRGSTVSSMVIKYSWNVCSYNKKNAPLLHPLRA